MINNDVRKVTILSYKNFFQLMNILNLIVKGFDGFISNFNCDYNDIQRRRSELTQCNLYCGFY